MKSVGRYAVAVCFASAIVWSGCDSNEVDDGNGNGDADVLVGEWSATSIKAGPVDVLGLLGLTMTLTLEEDGSAMIVAVEDDGSTTELTGTYTIDEQAKTITLEGDDIDGQLVIEYEIVDQNMISLEFESEDLEDLGFDLGSIGGILLDVPITVELERVAG